MTLPLVLLHGFLGDPSEWDDTREFLPCTIACRCPELVPARSWNEGVARLMEALPEDRIILGGYSMGARIAMAVADRIPRRIAGLIVVAGNPGLPLDQRAERAAHDQLLARRLEEESADQFLEHWYGQPLFASTAELTRRKWISSRRAMDRPRQANLLRCFSIANQPELWQAMKAWDFPVLGVSGERDDKYGQVLAMMKSSISRMRHCVIPATGHAVHRESPDQVAAAIHAFLASIIE